MKTTRQAIRPTWEHRLQAVLALLGGEPVPHVTARFGMGRSILYKWRHRALTALQGARKPLRLPRCLRRGGMSVMAGASMSPAMRGLGVQWRHGPPKNTPCRL